jgi:hypothetical protein
MISGCVPQQKKKSEALQQSVYLLTTERDQIRLDKVHFRFCFSEH